MTNIIAQLERRYDSFINEPKSWDFFIGVAEYVHYIKKVPVFIDLINQTLLQKAVDLHPTEELSKQALEDVKAAEGKLFKRIKKQKISYPELDSLIENHEGIKKGTRGGNAPIDDQLYYSLVEIIRELYYHDDGKYRQALTGLDLILDWPKYSRIEKFMFAPALDEKEQELMVLENKKDVAVWAAWDYLFEAYLVFFEGRAHLKNERETIPSGDAKKLWYNLRFGALLREREEIKNGNDSQAFFDMGFFKLFAKRVHGHLLEELEETPADGEARRELFNDEAGEIQLDKNIILSNGDELKPYLKFKALGSNKFQKQSIPPRTANIIHFLHNAFVNKYDQYSFTLTELAKKFTKNNKSDSSVSNQINLVTNLCKNSGVKQILHRNIEKRWQLNPGLDCCK